MSSALIFTETKNRKDKKDGDEFRIQANGLYNIWNMNDRIKDLGLYKAGARSHVEKRKFVIDSLSTFDDLRRLAFFCHGTPKGISMGFSVANIGTLATAIGAACESNVVHIGLYACLTGRGNFEGGRKNPKNLVDRHERIVTHREGFAMLLCRELDDIGIHAVVTAHLTSGHTTYNPYKVRIERIGDYITRRRMCGSDDRAEWKSWINRLNTDMTFRYDLMTDDWRCHG